MRKIRLHVVFIAVVLCGLLAGCGGAREKGKNQDFDRQKATEKK